MRFKIIGIYSTGTSLATTLNTLTDKKFDEITSFAREGDTDHQEIFAIAHLWQTAKGQIPSDEFAQGFLQGVHYMEILHEIRVMEAQNPPPQGE